MRFWEDGVAHSADHSTGTGGVARVLAEARLQLSDSGLQRCDLLE